MLYANSADPNQTVPKSGSTLFAIPLRIFKKQLHKKQHLSKKNKKNIWN